MKNDFYCIIKGEKEFVGSARTKYLSSEVAGGLTGVLMGLYAVDENGKWAEFEKLDLKVEDWVQGQFWNRIYAVRYIVC